MEIQYDSFKNDCQEIIFAYLKSFGYYFDSESSEDYINYYKNDYSIIEVSMLENFPHIGVSLDFLTLNKERVKRSKLNAFLEVNSAKEFEIYKEFASKNNVNDYKAQMNLVVLNLKEFYKPILDGKIQLKNLIQDYPS